MLKPKVHSATSILFWAVPVVGGIIMFSLLVYVFFLMAKTSSDAHDQINKMIRQAPTVSFKQLGAIAGTNMPVKMELLTAPRDSDFARSKWAFRRLQTLQIEVKNGTNGAIETNRYWKTLQQSPKELKFYDKDSKDYVTVDATALDDNGLKSIYEGALLGTIIDDVPEKWVEQRDGSAASYRVIGLPCSHALRIIGTVTKTTSGFALNSFGSKTATQNVLILQPDDDEYR